MRKNVSDSEWEVFRKSLIDLKPIGFVCLDIMDGSAAVFLMYLYDCVLGFH